MRDSGQDEAAEPPPDRTEPEAGRARPGAIVGARPAAVVPLDAERFAGSVADGRVGVSGADSTDRKTFLGPVRSGGPTHSARDAVTPPGARSHGDTATVTARITDTAPCGGRRCYADAGTTDVLVRRYGHGLCPLSRITPATPPSGS
ncbi:DUF4440 domain-containing protein [Streptomyces sp. NPDC007002]|uniref:DUF4440 domain-containing protein n=1 Tax=Streptomyces sp. NPDC007002 TaxID=3156910 RepID=UPI003455F26A